MVRVCTIIARNYLPHARVFAESLRAVHPEVLPTVLIVDGPADPGDESRFETLGLTDVVPDPAERQRLAFIYDVTELSTAVKPLLLRRLLARGSSAVLYFDPDIEIVSSIQTLWDAAQAHGVALIPHVLSPIPDDGLGITELFVLRAGIYNLGFIGVGPGSEPFLDWWWSKLRRHCVVEPQLGLFVDQRWIDYVPALFPHTIVRDPGVNVAYWNLYERRVRRVAAGYEVNGRPLRFFHFSGFDPANPHLLSKHQGAEPRILLSEQPAVREMCDVYARRLAECGGPEDESSPYAFAALPDGTKIELSLRRYYRQALLDAEQEGQPLPPLPFEGDALAEWLRGPSDAAPRVSRYLYELHRMRPDLQARFPRLFGETAGAYMEWAAQGDPEATGVPVAFRPRSLPERPYTALPGGLTIARSRTEGEASELAAFLSMAARGAGIPVVDVFRGQRHRGGIAPEAETSPTAAGEVVLACSANVDDLARALDALPRRMTQGPRIAFWSRETEEPPDGAALAALGLAEIWTVSARTASALRRVMATPVHVCPLPAWAPPPPALSRADLGLPSGRMFLAFLDAAPGADRDDPLAVLTAFRRAFPPDEGPHLVLCARGTSLVRFKREAVIEAARGRSDIHYREGVLRDGERDALLAHCDAYVSLHASPSCGLRLARAMALGKPAIASAHSGRLEFMTAENSFLVSETGTSAAASLLRTVFENPALAQERGRRARADMGERFSEAHVAAFVSTRLAALTHQPAVAAPVAVKVAPPTERVASRLFRFLGTRPKRALRAAAGRLLR